ncbi:MAG: flippase-like domain-containing protein [Actinobacteria bacterium]|nr:flippase-like domain-containing protein [Actinomycetota bacterium]
MGEEKTSETTEHPASGQVAMKDDQEAGKRVSRDGGSPKGSKLRRGFFLAVSLSVATLIVISLATLDRATLSALSNLSPGFLVLAASLSLGRWLWSVVRMRLLIRSVGEKVRLADITKTVYAGYFSGLVTPWRAGGVTGEMAFLYAYGLGPGESVAVVSFGACISTALLMLFFPFVILVARKYIDLSMSIQGFLFSALAVGLLYLALVLWAILRPHSAVGDTLLKHSPAFLRKRAWYQRFLERLIAEIQAFVICLRRLARIGRARLLAVGLLTCLYWFTGFLAVPVAVVGLGYGSYFWRAVVAQLVVHILMPFVPTPGGSGIGEVGFLYVYKSVLPDLGAAGLLTLIWRFMDFYLGLLVGGAAFMLIMRDIGRGSRVTTSRMSTEDTELPTRASRKE